VDEAAAAEALRDFGAQSGLSQLVEQYIWYFVIGFALLFLKDSVTNALAGIQVFIGSDYDEIWSVLSTQTGRAGQHEYPSLRYSAPRFICTRW